MPLVSVKLTFTLLFWHKILIPNFKRYCHEDLCMSQHTGSHKNSLNLLGEKYLNESHWPMHRIRLLECRAYFIELPSTFKMHSFIRKTSLFPFILVQETAVKLLINSSLHSMQNYFILQAFQASTKQKLKVCASLHKNLTENAKTYYMQLSLILQCFQDIFIIYQFQIMLGNGPECLKNGLKSTCFESAKMLDSTL